MNEHHAPPLARTLTLAAPIVAGVLGGRTPDAALAQLAPNERPAVMDAVFSTLRDYGRGDFLLARLMNTPLKEVGVPLIRALLLMALHRLESEPASAHVTVDQTVSAAATVHAGRYKALVNGVLRNFLRRTPELLAAAEADDVACWRHPAWWIARLRHDHPQDWQAILAAGNSHPPMSLRVNVRRLASADFLTRLNAAGISASMQPDDSILLAHPVPVARLPGFAEGLCSVQDAGAQRAARLLDVHDGMRVLDACAAPGGKTAHILERADAELLALDVDAERARQIETTLQRLDLRARVQVADARKSQRWGDGDTSGQGGVSFDRILLDAPCSASGVVRRHADAKWLRRESDIKGFARTQRELLDALWPALAPGGKMLYATCSLFARENTQQVADFLQRHSDATLADKELSLLPDAHHDGFFYALLRKR